MVSGQYCEVFIKSLLQGSVCEAAWLPLAAEEGGFRVWGSSARLAALLRASEEVGRAVVGGARSSCRAFVTGRKHRPHVSRREHL